MKIWRPYTQEQVTPPPLAVSSAEGSYLILADGRRIFDGISSWWLITHGHARPEIARAIATQSEKLDQVVFANFTHPAAERLAELLAERLPPSLNRVFFSDNGSTAVEVAMKAAYQFFQQNGQPQRKHFLTFDKAYHGDTCGAMSVSRDGDFTQSYRGMLFDVFRCHQPDRGMDVDEWTRPFLAMLDEWGDKICAVLLEPLLQGAGGMIVWPKEAVKIICTAARQRGVKVIFDEVMTGFGRTGSFFAFEQVGFVPDFVCLSKGVTGGYLPLGLTITMDEIYQGFLGEQASRMLFHGHSFTGNALSCAAAVANLEIWSQENVLHRLSQLEKSHHEALENTPASIPILDRRVCGTVGILELDLPGGYGGPWARQFNQRCLENGLYLRALGSTVYLMPPYCSTRSDVLNAWNIVFEAIASTLASAQ